jgi:CheY-like chemotaxis protein
VRTAIASPPVDGLDEGLDAPDRIILSGKSHLEVEGEPSTILQALQVLCEICRMIRTYVRLGSAVLRTCTAPRVCDDQAVPTALVVDDHPSFRASARATLEDAGFEVVGEAADGATALEMLERLAPDLVLLDVQLPDMTGFDVCSECASLDRTVVVLVSSRDDTDYHGLIEECGARGFIPKGELTGEAVAAFLS